MKTFYFFLLLVFFSLSLGYLTEILLDVDKLIFDSFGEKFTDKQLEKAFGFYKKWNWIKYFFLPIYLVIKISIICVILQLGAFFLDNKDLSFKAIFSIVVKSEFIFLLVIVSKLIYFYFFNTTYILEDIQFLYPFSALNIVGQDIDPWFVYPLQILNLFELAYWFVLAYLIAKELKISMDNGFKIVASSYVPALTVWVVAVMFITLNYS